MIGEHPNTEQLQLSYDGELSPCESAEIAAHVAGCAQCRAHLTKLARIGEFVRSAVAPAHDAAHSAHAASSVEPDFARMFQAIESALQNDELAPQPRESWTQSQGALIHKLNGRSSRKVSTASAATVADQPLTRAAALRTPVQPRSKQTTRAERLHHRLVRGAPALGAVALAAAALLIVYRQDQPALEVMDDAVLEASVDGPSEILDVDFGSNNGQVIAIPLSDGSSVPVVWIEDDDSHDGEDSEDDEEE